MLATLFSSAYPLLIQREEQTGMVHFHWVSMIELIVR